MNGARWKGALLVALASAGLAWADPPKVPAQPAEQGVTIELPHSPPTRCRVVKAWRTGDGRQAWLLQSIEGHMMVTAVATTHGPAGASLVGVSLFPWDNSNVPPKGAPVPPPDHDVRPVAYTAPAPEPHVMPAPAPAPRAMPAPAPEPHVMPAPVVGPPEPPPAAVHETACCDGSQAGGVLGHHFEGPALLHSMSGRHWPMCFPDHAPGFGYYLTQWRSFPYGAVPPVISPRAAPAEQLELLPPPKVSRR